MWTSLFFCAFPLATPIQESQGQDLGSHPNVLFLLADDLGWMDVGFQNPDSFYATPNLDRLREGGVQLTSAYAACPVCSPTRASILTGRHPARINTTDYFGAPQPSAVLKAGREGAKRLERFQKLPLLAAEYVPHLPQEEFTLAEVLGAAGYDTFFAGKWHLGGDGFEPETQGFDVNVAGDRRGGPYGPGRYFHPFGMPHLESEEGDHLPARLAEESVKFITAKRDNPWLCYLSFYSVHTPLMGRPDLVTKYEKKAQELGLEPEWGQEGERRVRQVQEHAVYAAMVEAMDAAVGEVLDALDASGQAENTIVVFFSDNGGLSTSEGHPTSNLPLRGGKGWLFEGGVREPCTLRWPGKIPKGSTLDLPVQSVDFLPTLLAAVGVSTPELVELDGLNILPVLEDPAGPIPEHLAERSLYWHYPHYGNQGGFPGGAIRRGPWKLVARYVPGDEGMTAELYDLEKDIGEANDVAEAHPEVVSELTAEFRRWQTEVDARMPRANPLMGGDAGEKSDD